MNWKHWAQVAAWGIGGAATAIAQGDPSLAAVCHVVAGLAATVAFYFGMTSPKVGAAS